MYRADRLPAEPALAHVPAVLPLNVLLALALSPEALPGSRPVNLFGVLATLFHANGWDGARKVLNPRIWAPDWSAEALLALTEESPGSAPRFPELGNPQQMEVLRVSSFPGESALRNPRRRGYPRYDIVHFVGRAEDRMGSLVLDLGGTAGGALPVELLAPALIAART